MFKGDSLEQFEIKSDALGIIKRIKAWNKNYSVYYNLKNKKFMLYLTETELKPKVYCLTYPFNEIDERMFDYTLKSEMQNRKAVLEEIEKSNALLLMQEQKKIKNLMENNLES